MAIKKWLKYAPLLDEREDPFIEVAAFYPTTKSHLEEEVFSNINASTFFQRAASLRPYLDYDYCCEKMIKDGALSKYKVLIFFSRSQDPEYVEEDVLKIIDQWVQNGGIVIYPYMNVLPLATVEGDYTIFNKWSRGETGRGKVIFHDLDYEPLDRYSRFLKEQLLKLDILDSLTHDMLKIKKPFEVYVSVLKNGKFAFLNYNDDTSTVVMPDGREIIMEPYSIKIYKSH